MSELDHIIRQIPFEELVALVVLVRLVEVFGALSSQLSALNCAPEARSA